ncbi:MAG: sigma 54-interacting transcriptional regulator [Nitrospirota bacterium]
MKNKKYKFALLSNSAKVCEMVKHYSDPETEELIVKLVKLARMEEAVPVAQKLLDEGVEVILALRGFGDILAQTIGQPVVKIAITHQDILNALIEAKNYSSNIGLVSFSIPTDGIEVFENLLSIKIRQIIYSTTEELMNGISKAVEEGISCVVGGGIANQIITSLGGVGIIIFATKGAILQALREARAIASTRRKEQRDTAQLRAILETIKEGVIVVDNNGRIKTFNQTAEEILGIELKKEVGKSLPELCSEPLSSHCALRFTGLFNVLRTGKPEMDQICHIGDLHVVINSLPFKVGDMTQGVVLTFKEASSIQKIDRKLREELYKKGFVAKYTIDQIKGESTTMKEVVYNAKKYAETDATILIQGETGTGKEIFAQSIHNLSSRKNKPFVAINCSALSESLLESELFGYEEGAFTGAKRGGKVSLFELANEGTIFLDEIADISQNLQVRLLRVLEEKEVMRVGGDRIVPIDVRIISSTYKDLWRDVKLGRFRMDLYFRLAILKLDIPPLRERPEDIPVIIKEILYKYTRGRKRISETMIENMKEYNWPGNIRELDSLIKRYVILLGESVSDDSLLLKLFEGLDNHIIITREASNISGKLSSDISQQTLKEQVEEYEKAIIKDTLRKFRSNKKETAKRLGISLNTLWRKLHSSNRSH